MWKNKSSPPPVLMKPKPFSVNFLIVPSDILPFTSLKTGLCGVAFAVCSGRSTARRDYRGWIGAVSSVFFQVPEVSLVCLPHCPFHPQSPPHPHLAATAPPSPPS